MNDDDFSISLGDAFDLIKTIPDQSVDLLLTDPPYNISNYSTGNIKFNGRRKDFNNDIADWDKDVIEPTMIVSEAVRVLKPTGNIFIFSSSNYFGKWHSCLDPLFDTFQFMAWHKTNPAPSIRKSSFLNSIELIACCWNKGHTWNFLSQREMHNFIETPICAGHERLAHPTQKPLKLLQHIIVRASQSGQTVLDPFMGVGSVGVAAVALGRRFHGFEIHQPYYELAQARLHQTRHLHNIGRHYGKEKSSPVSGHPSSVESEEGDQHVGERMDGHTGSAD